VPKTLDLEISPGNRNWLTPTARSASRFLAVCVDCNLEPDSSRPSKSGARWARSLSGMMKNCPQWDLQGLFLMSEESHKHPESGLSGMPHSRPSSPTDPTLASDAHSPALAAAHSSGTTTTIARSGVTPGAIQKAPEQVGPYHIREQLGEGGMGVVYLAERLEPVRMTVALKLIKLGMDTEEVVARFESERQALALMSHPNIARVLDAGATVDGRPYFVMEYVPGVPITHYCDTHRLSNSERLTLFITVCEAVQHAHAKGLIHRDLKPSNVLVMVQGDRPLPKIIDFGVAKAVNQRLTEKTLFTQHGQLVGTPEYMSPEQAEMSSLEIDSRSDIYSLGVLLYELLIGALPFDSKTLRRAGFAEIQRIIREVDPPKPSTRLSSMIAMTPAVPGTPNPVSSVASTFAHQRRQNIKSLHAQLRGDLDWITMKAMDKDRTRRYLTAEAFAQDIARFLASQPVQARPPSIPYRLRKFARRRRSALIVTGSLVAIVLLAVSFVTYAQRARVRRSNDLNSLAIKQMRQMDHPGAEKTLREAMDLNPSNYTALANFTTVKRFEYEQTKDMKVVDEALRLLDTAIAAQPRRAEPSNIKGVFLRAIGRNDDAIAALQKGIAADRDYFATYVSLANAYVVARNWEQAEKQLILADPLPSTHDDPRPWQRWYNLAALQLALNKPEAAKAINKALDADGRKSPDVWLLYAKICLLLPSSKDAKAARDAVIRANVEDPARAGNDPSHPSWRIQRILALAELANGNNDDAAAAAKRAIDLKDPLPVYDLLIVGAAKKDQRSISDAAAQWPAGLQKDRIQATIDGGLVWIETIGELESMRARLANSSS
jgi:serine/threonine protein kinase